MNYRSVLFASLVVSAVSLSAAPGIEFDTKEFNCGILPEGKTDKLEAVFNVKNTGDDTLKLLKVKPSCGCTVVKFDSTILPGTSTAIKSTVNVKGRKGSISKGITVTSNAPNDSIVRLVIKANIIEALSPSLSYINMADENAEKGTSINITTMKKDLKISDITFVPEKEPNATSKVTFTLTPSDSARTDGLYVYKLDLKPITLAKKTDGAFIIKTNHPERKEMSLRGVAGK